MALSDLLKPVGIILNGLVTLILNAVESYQLIKLGSRRKSHETLILSLSISDFFVGFGTFTAQLLAMLLDRHQLIANEDEKRYKIKTTVEVPIWFSLYLSLFHLVTITVDRAIAITYPTRHRVWVTPWRVRMCIIMAWLASTTIICFLMVYAHTTSLSMISSFSRIRLFFAGFCLGVGLVAALSYFFIIKKAIYERKKIMKNLGENRDDKKTTKKERRLLFISLAVVLSFVVCVLPNSIEAFMLKRESYMAEFPVVSNSIINSVTYFYGRYLDCRR